MNNLTISYTENDRTVVYSQDLPESPMVDDVIETYLAAYDSFGFQNDLDVIVRNGFLGDTKISFDSENYISKEDHSDCSIGQYKYQSEMYFDAWSTVWDTILYNMPEDILEDILNKDGSGIDKAQEAILFLIDHYNETQECSNTSDISYVFTDCLEELLDELHGEKWYMGYRY